VLLKTALLLLEFIVQSHHCGLGSRTGELCPAFKKKSVKEFAIFTGVIRHVCFPCWEGPAFWETVWVEGEGDWF
jgi:hypothetical protein